MTSSRLLSRRAKSVLETVKDAHGAPAQPHRAVDTIEVMLRAGTIEKEMGASAADRGNSMSQLEKPLGPSPARLRHGRVGINVVVSNGSERAIGRAQCPRRLGPHAGRAS